MKINALAAYQTGESLKDYSFDPGELQDYDCLIKVLACGICHPACNVLIVSKVTKIFATKTKV